MKQCPECGRNLSKNLHNWSEVMAGLALILVMAPIINFIAKYDRWAAVSSIVGLIVLYTVCLLHLLAELRWQR